MNEIIKFLKKRRSVTAKKMLPGKVKDNDLRDILECALRVPDHGALSPWKIVVIQNDMRKTIGEKILLPANICFGAGETFIRAGIATNLCNSSNSGCSVGSEIWRDISNSQSSDSK